MSALHEALEREREAYTADPADCERCRFVPNGRCQFHADLETGSGIDWFRAANPENKQPRRGATEKFGMKGVSA